MGIMHYTESTSTKRNSNILDEIGLSEQLEYPPETEEPLLFQEHVRHAGEVKYGEWTET